MARRAIYERLLSVFESEFSKNARDSIESALADAERRAEEGFKRETYGWDKAHTIEYIADRFVGGLTDILKCHNLTCESPNFEWAVERYGNAFLYGAIDSEAGFNYSSKEVTPGVISMQLIPMNRRQERYIKLYETAVTQKLMDPLAGMDTSFEDHQGSGGAVFRKLVIKLPW